MKKMRLLLLFFIASNSYTFTPGQQEKRGLKRYIDEIMPAVQNRPSLQDLQAAAYHGTAAELTQLLDASDFDIDATGDDGNTLLMYAADSGNVPTLNVLIQRGADINLQNASGDTALHFAAVKNRPEIIQQLVQRPEILLNMANDQGNTPLMMAILNRSPQVIASLLHPEIMTRGLDINKYNNDGSYPLIVAIEFNNEPLLNQLLLLGATVNVDGHQLEVPLLRAVVDGKGPLVRRLLKVPGINVNLANSEGQTALMLAAHLNYLGAARLLINAGAQVELKDNEGNTTIDYAKNSESRNIGRMITLLREARRLE